jgi:hypothetical protein
MKQLPNEIQDIVCRHLSNNDLRALRLTCRDTVRSPTALLFQSVDIFPFEESFQWIAENAEIRRHVRCVRYVAKVVTAYDSFDDYKQFGVGSRLYIPQRLEVLGRYTDEQLFDHYNLYRAYLKNQFQMLLKGGMMLNALTALFSNLPQLRELALVAGEEGGRSDNIPDDEDLHPVERETLIRLEPLTAANLYTANYEPPEDIYEQQLRILLAASKLSGRRIEKLTATNVGWSFFDALPEGPQHVQGYLRSIKHLSVSFDSVDSDLAVSKQVRKGRKRIAELLTAPNDLEVLDVSFNEGGYRIGDNERRLISFAELVFEPESGLLRRWPNLRELKLKNLEIGRYEFLEFLTLHKKTLRRLELENILLDDEWDQVDEMGEIPDEEKSLLWLFTEMKEKLKLEHVSFLGDLVNEAADEHERGELWEVKNNLSCCRRGGFHTQCLKGKIENFIVNGGKPVDIQDLLQGDPSWQSLGMDFESYDVGDM